MADLITDVRSKLAKQRKCSHGSLWLVYLNGFQEWQHTRPWFVTKVKCTNCGKVWDESRVQCGI